MSHIDSTKNARRAVIASELEWHEQEAHRRFSLDAFLYAPPAFDRVVASSFSFMQLRPGGIALDMGCGEGKETLQLARKGAVVVSTDLSYQQLLRARELLQESIPGARVWFVQANAEELPFAANTFPIIYGKAILHHLDLSISAAEINRLLKPGGRATLAEPMAHHPLIWLGRWLTPRLRTKDEHPLTFRELHHFSARFNQSEIEEYFLLTPVSYLFRILPGGEGLFRRLHTALHQLDRRLFRWFRPLKNLAWYSLVKIEK